MDETLSKNHPRYRSLIERERLVAGFEEGFVARAGLIAHGRGEAFDYLLGEQTVPEAEDALRAAAARLLLADYPVVSVNGNVAALVAKETAALASAVGAAIEVNLFYWAEERERAIRKVLEDAGAREVLGTGEGPFQQVPGLDSARGRVDERGIWRADCVVAPLEDGDRTEALLAMGKDVVTVDLNPLSRTAQKASISIVDNITRAFPRLLSCVELLKSESRREWEDVLAAFDNQETLDRVVARVRRGV